MMEDVFCVMEALGLERPALCGHSDGGVIGLMLALAHPGSVSLMAVSGTNLSPAGLKEDFLRGCEAEYACRPDPLIRLMLDEPDIPPEALKDIRIPVLVTAGEDDLIRPEETRRIAEALPDAALRILPGEDHGSYVIGSETMGSMLLDFMKEHGY